MPALDWLTKRPIAHRGFHDLNHKSWENTLSAFVLAVQADFAIECDVRLSSDGVTIIFHDEDLKRLTGQEGSIHQLTAAQAKALTIGGTTDHIPTLREVLDLIAGRVPIIIELKDNPYHDDALVASVASELSDYPGHAAIMSCDHHLIRRFPIDAPRIPSGLVAEGLTTKEIETHFSMLAYDLSFISYNIDHLSNPFIKFVREKLRIPVISWTVRNETSQKVSDLHADQITFEGFNPDVMITADGV